MKKNVSIFENYNTYSPTLEPHFNTDFWGP